MDTTEIWFGVTLERARRLARDFAQPASRLAIGRRFGVDMSSDATAAHIFDDLPQHAAAAMAKQMRAGGR
jgi:hypothetical protein